MINKWLDKMENAIEKHDGCWVVTTLKQLGYIEGTCADITCVECKERVLKTIEEIRKQAITDETSDTSSDTSSETRKELDNVNHQKHQNMTIRNLVEVGYFKFAVKLDDSYYEFECLPTDFIDFVYGEDFLNQEIIAIEQGTDGKMYVTLKEE